MGGLGNRGGFTTKPDHRGSPGSNPDGNHKRFVSSQIEVLHLQVFPKGKKNFLVGEATIRVLGVTVKGILLKQGKYGVFCHMPQYYSEKKGYQDVIYSPSKRLRDAIFQTVLETYQERQKE